MKNKKSKYQYPEAYMLMIYACMKCKRVEIIWNSRDGVSPGMFECRSCDGGGLIVYNKDGTKSKINVNASMRSVAHEAYICVPDFKPPKGMRIFEDMTEEDFAEINVPYKKGEPKITTCK